MDAGDALPLGPPEGGSAEGLRVIEQVLLASKAIRRSLEELLVPAGLDGSEFLLLWNIAERREQSQAELADRLGCSNAQISQLSDQLRRRGWLVAQRDARDRRRQHWTLTPLGHQVLAGAHEALGIWCQKLQASIGPWELSSFGEALERLILVQPASAASILPASSSHKEAA